MSASTASVAASASTAAAVPGPTTVPHPSPVDASYRLVPAFERDRPHGHGRAQTRTSDDGAAAATGIGADSDNDDEWEWSEDEELVTLDLGRWGQEHGASAAAAAGDSSQLAITGLETSTPWLQRGQVVYKGQWVRLVGTEILLERARGTCALFSF